VLITIFFILLSILLEFHARPFKLLDQPFQFSFPFTFGPCQFDYYFLFWIIYEIKNIFLIPPPFIFILSNLVPIFFIAICFVWDYFLDFFTVSSSLGFFSYQIWFSFFLLLSFFALASFLNWYFFFMISSFKIKLVGN
jgi:hypothetical protein